MTFTVLVRETQNGPDLRTYQKSWNYFVWYWKIKHTRFCNTKGITIIIIVCTSLTPSIPVCLSESCRSCTRYAKWIYPVYPHVSKFIQLFHKILDLLSAKGLFAHVFRRDHQETNWVNFTISDCESPTRPQCPRYMQCIIKLCQCI